MEKIKNSVNSLTPPQQERLMREKLRIRNQGRSESINKYALDIMDLCMKMDSSMSDEEMGKYFLDGLLPELKHKLLLGTEKSFTALKSQAEVLEQVSKVEQSSNIIQKTRSIKTLEQENNLLKKEISQLKKPHKSSEEDRKNKKFPSKKAFQGKCYNCGKAGHKAKNCWLPIKKQNSHKTNLVEQNTHVNAKESKIQVLRTIAQIGDHDVTPVLDTGSTVTIISQKLKKELP